MATIASSPIERQSAERRFYSRMALFLVAVVLIGFGPSFYLRDIVPSYPRPNPSLPPSVLLHGGIFTLWMLALIAQTQLVAADRRDLHMKLGIVGMLLALALVPVMYLTSVWQVARANQPPFTDPLTWTIVPLGVIPSFIVLIAMGWSRRREAQWHKRLMMSAAILVVAGPSIGRMPIAPPTLGGFLAQLTIGMLLFVPMVIWDRRMAGAIHPATRLGILLTALAAYVPWALVALDAWRPIAERLPGIGS